MRRGVAIVTLVLLITPLSLWVSFPFYGQWAANHVLNPYGIRVLELTIGRPYYSQQRFEQYIGHARLQLSSGDILELHQLGFTYAFDSDAMDITVTRAGLALRGKPSTLHSNQSSLPQIADYLPAQYWDSVPSLNVVVDTFSFTGGVVPDPLTFVAMSNGTGRTLNDVRFTKTPEQMAIRTTIGELVSDQGIPVSISLDISKSNSFYARAFFQDEETSLLECNLSVDEQGGDDLAVTVDMNLSRFPIGGYLEALHKQALDLSAVFNTQLHLTLRNQTIQQLVQSPEVSLRGKIALALSGLEGEFAQLNANYQGAISADDWQLLFEPVRENDEMVVIKKPVNKEEHLLRLQGNMKVNFERDNGWLEITPEKTKKPIRLVYQRGRVEVLNYELQQLNWNMMASAQSDVIVAHSGKVDIDASQLKRVIDTIEPKRLEPVMFEAGTVQALFAAEWKHDQLDLRLTDRFESQFERINYNDFYAEKLHLVLPVQSISYGYSGTVSNLHFAADVEHLMKKDTLDIDSIALKGHVKADPQSWRWHFSHQPVAINIMGPQRTIILPRQNYDGVFIDKEGFAKTDFTISNVCNQKILEGSLNSNQLGIKMEKTLSASNSLTRWLNIPQLTSDISKGHLNAELNWRFENAWPDVRVLLENGSIGGSLGEFEGVQATFSGNDGYYKLVSGVESMNMGVDINDFDAQLEFDLQGAYEAIVVKSLQADVFDGRVKITDQKLVLGQTSLINIQIESIDLNEVIRTQNLSGLNTSGRLSGVQPLLIDEKGNVSLENGVLGSHGSGVIQYQSGVADSMDVNAQLKLTLDVLKNFHYQTLKTKTSFKNGNLIFQSSISGRNPDVASGQRVDLNLNTEVLLLPAIQAMRIQNGLEARVEKLINPKSKQTNSEYCR